MTVTTWSSFSLPSRLVLLPFFFFYFFFFAADLPISFNRDALASVNEVGANRLPTLSPLCLLVLSTPLSSLSSILSLTSPLFFSISIVSHSVCFPRGWLAIDTNSCLVWRRWIRVCSCLNEITYIYAHILVSYLSTISSNIWTCGQCSELIGTDRHRSWPLVIVIYRKRTYSLLIFVEIFLGNLEESRIKTNNRVDI